MSFLAARKRTTLPVYERGGGGLSLTGNARLKYFFLIWMSSLIRFQLPIAHHIHYPAWAVAAADMRRSKDALQKKLAILEQAKTHTVFNLA